MKVVTLQDDFLPPERLIRSIIFKNLIETGYFCRDEADDLYQEIVLDLLNRKTAIIKSFKGLSRFSTFLYTVICRQCLEIKRKKIRDRKRIVEIDPVNYNPEEKEPTLAESIQFSAEDKYILEDYCKRFGLILDMFGSKKTKLLFSLKSLYRIMVYVVDLPSYTISESEKESILSWIEQLNNLEKTRTDQEVYVQLTLIFNLLEHKKNTNDAIRKWIEDRLGQIISLLNNRSFSSSFNLESVQFLVEYCHARNFLA